MSTPTPPPLPPVAGPGPGQAPHQTQAAPAGPPSSGARPGTVVAILAAVLGGVIVLGTIASTAFSAVVAGGAVDETRTLDTAGISSIEVNASAAQMTVVFGDVPEATLDVRDARGAWTLSRDDDELIVRGPDGPFFGWFVGGPTTRATLTLPSSLDRGLDAELRVGAGSLRADGTFGELDLRVEAGSLTVTGSAQSVSADVGAGRGELSLRDVAEIDMEVNAGRITGDFTGRSPNEVSIGVNAGSGTLTLPRATYDVRSQVEVGSLDNRLETSTSSPRTVAVSVSVGNVTLRHAD